MAYIHRDIPGLLIYQDGRVVCTDSTAGRRWYSRFRKILWKRAKGICIGCTLEIPLEEATFDHTRSRGFGGGFRDDSPWRVVITGGVPHFMIPRQRQNQMLCGACNSEKGSKRG